MPVCRSPAAAARAADDAVDASRRRSAALAGAALPLAAARPSRWAGRAVDAPGRVALAALALGLGVAPLGVGVEGDDEKEESRGADGRLTLAQFL